MEKEFFFRMLYSIMSFIKVRSIDMEKKKKKVKYFDYSLLIVLVFLICFGLVMLYSSSYYSAQRKFGDGTFYLKRQIIASIVSFLIMWGVSWIDYRIYYKYAGLIYCLSIPIMCAVWIPGLGIEAYGARRWIRLPVFGQMQPAEVAKIAVILFIPLILCRMGDKINTKKGLLYALACGVFQALIIRFVTDNLSTAIIVVGITCIMIFVVHKNTSWFLGIASAGVALTIIIQQIGGRLLNSRIELGNFRSNRILVWLNPELYERSGGYQVMQGFYAIGSGGFFGKGLGNGAQKMLIPEPQNDMILSIIAEELGIFGVIVVLTLFGILLYRLMFIAQNAPDKYSSLIVTGIMAHIAIQVILNVCVVLNIVPTTGITLPFISYGGTALVFLMIEMGIALGISRKIKIED